MTRSSWHWFWILLTGFSLVMIVVCLLAGRGVPQSGVMPQGDIMQQMLRADAARMAADLAGLLVYFWAGVFALSGMAWAACALALRERQYYFGRNRRPETLAEGVVRETGVDVELRA